MSITCVDGGREQAGRQEWRDRWGKHLVDFNSHTERLKEDPARTREMGGKKIWRGSGGHQARRRREYRKKGGGK